MLSPRLTTCSECANILTLIDEIDCKISKMSDILYTNLVFMLNAPIKADIIISLLNYKRILQYKYVNSDYACNYAVNDIAEKVKLLIFK